MARSTKESAIARARALAIEHDVLWICKGLWLEGPLPRRYLERWVGRSRFARAEAHGFIVGIETRAGKLFTAGPKGRLAIGLDRSSMPGVAPLEEAFARRVVVEALLSGCKPYRPGAEGSGWLEGRVEQGRGAGRCYINDYGLEHWLLVGLPNFSRATAGRLVHERSQGEAVYLVSSDMRQLEGWPDRVTWYLWSEALLEVGSLLRPSLERLLKARGYREA